MGPHGGPWGPMGPHGAPMGYSCGVAPPGHITLGIPQSIDPVSHGHELPPTEIKLLAEIKKKKIRVGGMVKKESIIIKSEEVKFVITDLKNEINVTYSGAVPNLFSEGKGVVAEGYLKDKNFFLATKILAKHDENYMPPEVKASLEGK